MADARLTAAKLLIKLEESGAYSNILLDSALSSAELGDRDRAFASALFYGVTERRLTLDYIIKKNSRLPFEKLEPAALAVLRLGLYQLMYMPSVPESAAVNESVRLCKKLRAFGAQGFVNGMLRGFIRGGKRIDYRGLSQTERIAVEYSCPEWLAEKLTREYGTENALRALSASLGRPPVYARVNTLRTNPDDLIKALRREGIIAKKYPALENCLVLEKTGGIEKSKAFRSGLFHVQDISSQLCCLTLRPVVNETVLDMCAAPGGKSFTMAELMGGNGRVLSLDMHDMRVGLIEDGASRLGLKIVEARDNNALVFDPQLPVADRVLCDVPCSGLGVIRRKPEIKYKDPAEFDALPKIQRDILEMSSRYVKVGGTLVYSTCTLSRAENDDVAEDFARAHPEFAPIVCPVPWAGADNCYKRTYFPDPEAGDGFFTASFRRIK